MVKNRRRKNFFITLLFIILFWSTFGFMIYFIEPEAIKDFILPDAYILFFLNLFLALFFTLAVLFANSRRGLLITIGIIIFLILRFNRLDNLLIVLLIVASIGALEYHFTQRN